MITDERDGWNRAWAEASVEAEVATLRYDWVQPFVAFVAKHLRPGARVLEAGCGRGASCTGSLNRATCP